MKTDRKYWNRWYLGVILFLIVQIIVYYFITDYFK